MMMRRAFTLVELLVTIGIIALLSGMIIMVPEGDKRDVVVRGAAEELAATLRQARSMAIQRQAVTGVVFNISNGAGTSGRVLNNNDGGHWYRIIGPWEDYTWGGGNSAPAAVGPPVSGNMSNSVTWCLSARLERVQACWVGDTHTLPKGAVRFLALTDQDNGIPRDYSSTSWRVYPATYPRPWFGRYDTATKRLYPWGGYDPAIVDRLNRPCSGFYFQGSDPAIEGCLNPADRVTTATSQEFAAGLLSQGQVRPLVNADWLDYMIHFLPDGRAGENWGMNPFHFRQESLEGQNSGGGANALGDIGDLSGMGGAPKNPVMNNYHRHNGGFTISLAPDDVMDTDVFDSALDAYKSIFPVYRVHVGKAGRIESFRVSPGVPDGVVWESTISDWQDGLRTGDYYRDNMLTEYRSYTLRGQPVYDFLSPGVMASGQWWMEAP